MPRPRKEFTVDVLGCCERHGRCTGEVCVTHLADHSPKSRNRPKGTMCIVTVKRCRLSRTQGTGSYWHRQGRRIRDQRLGVEEVRRQPKQRKINFERQSHWGTILTPLHHISTRRRRLRFGSSLPDFGLVEEAVVTRDQEDRRAVADGPSRRLRKCMQTRPNLGRGCRMSDT